MSMRQAEMWLGMRQTSRGLGLKNLLLARERELGKVFMVRGRGHGRGTRYRVTKSALRRHCRHLIPSKVDELRDKFSEFLRGVDERIANSVAEHVAEHVEPELHELWERDETQAEAIKELSTRVARLAGAPLKSA
jgi:hypothetical protein